jgi:hypothetical protein
MRFFSRNYETEKFFLLLFFRKRLIIQGKASIIRGNRGGFPFVLSLYQGLNHLPVLTPYQNHQAINTTVKVSKE